MNDMPPRPSRVIFLCMLLVLGAALFAWGGSAIRRGRWQQAPPQVNVVDSPADWWKGAPPGQTIHEYARARGYDPGAPFVTSKEAQRLAMLHQAKRVARFTALICGATLVIGAVDLLRRLAL